MDNYYFNCQCDSLNHIFRFVYDQTDNSVWLEAHLNHYLPWYKRVWLAMKYIFKCGSESGHYDTAMVRDEELVKLDDLLSRVVEYHSALNKEEAQSLCQYLLNHPSSKGLIKGAWICCLQGSNPEQWVIDTINHNGIFVRIYNGMKISNK